MKRTIVLLATLLLSFGLIQGQVRNADIAIGGMIEDSLRIDVAATLDVSLEQDYILGGMSLGFEVWSPDGATWSWKNVGGLGTLTQCVTLELASRLGDGSVFDMTGFLVTEADVDELSNPTDVIMGGGVAMMVGLPAGPMDHLYSYNFTPGNPAGPDAADAKTLCFDSVFVPPSGAFVFVDGGGGADYPITLWPNGGLCVPVTGARNFCPEFDGGNPTAMSIDHCGSGMITLAASDFEGDDIAYGPAVVTGGGAAAAINASGELSYTPVPADVGATITIEVGIGDAYNDASLCGTWMVDVTVTNNPPTIDCGAANNPVGKGNTVVKTDIVGGDADACDVIEYALVSETPAFVTGGAVDFVTGVYTVGTDGGGADNGFHTVVVSVTDGYATTTCNFTVEVLAVEPYEVQIEKTHGSLQGHFVDVEITMNKGSETMGGFDFLIGYDASVLAFTEAALSDYLVACGWEYFTYRYNWNGNCGNACPSGLLRLVGMAETNNGANHPDFDCINGENMNGEVIATLTFFVSNDRTLECMYVPVRFYWMDCGDNTIAVASGDTLCINRYIYTVSGLEIQDYMHGFPSMVGAPDDPCLEGDKVTPARFIDFINGGIDIVCADSIDARGDINVNGVANEIADAVMFTNYFINGLSAFGGHIDASIAASDVNADGIALSVADLVYLVRVIIGDANPYPKPLPETPVTISARGGAVTYDSPVDIGAALLTFNVTGDVGQPQLGNGAATMDMKYAQDGDELRVLVYNIGSEMIAAGENVLVTVPGNVELTGAEVATYDGFGIDVLVRNLPQSFSVTNYPNPFNPSTKICLALPNASAWTVKIYNVAGQLVNEFSDYSEAGMVEVMWNGTDNNGSAVASGIYFYKAQAGQYTATRKMVLMK